MSAKIIHPAFRTYDIERATAFYNKYFGFTLAASADLGDFTLNFFKDAGGQVELELTVFKDTSKTTGMRDGGFDHLAISVDDVDALQATMKNDGHNPTDLIDIKLGDVVLARLFYVNDPDGYKLEVVKRGGRWA